MKCCVVAIFSNTSSALRVHVLPTMNLMQRLDPCLIILIEVAFTQPIDNFHSYHEKQNGVFTSDSSWSPWSTRYRTLRGIGNFLESTARIGSEVDPETATSWNLVVVVDLQYPQILLREGVSWQWRRLT